MRGRVGIAVVGLLLAACTSGAGKPVVSVRAVSFEPAQISIEPGSSVEWHNEDDFTHTVTARDGGFDGELPAGGSFTQAFEDAGSFAYLCEIHPQNMQGTVTVG